MHNAHCYNNKKKAYWEDDSCFDRPRYMLGYMVAEDERLFLWVPRPVPKNVSLQWLWLSQPVLLCPPILCSLSPTHPTLLYFPPSFLWTLRTTSFHTALQSSIKNRENTQWRWIVNTSPKAHTALSYCPVTIRLNILSLKMLGWTHSNDLLPLTELKCPQHS